MIENWKVSFKATVIILILFRDIDVLMLHVLILYGVDIDGEAITIITE